MPDVELARSYRYVEAWGMVTGAYSRVLYPRSVAEIRQAFALAAREKLTLCLRGTGNSYGDASVSSAGLVLDLSRMNRLLSFDAETGIAAVEPGVSVRQLWRAILPQGWWPRVVSGTSFPTIGGIAAANIHGKNNFALGTVGDAIREFDIVLPSGEVRTCSREKEADLFHAAIGSFGLLGVFSRIVLGTKHVHSGELEVQTFASHDLLEMMEYMERERSSADYLVGWVDCFAKGDALGRGQVHRARYLEPDEDPDPERTLSLAHQEIPPTVLGVFPKSELWRFVRLLNNDRGMRWLNAARYWQGRLEGALAPQRWTHAEFAFLLDAIPNWKWSYGRVPGRGLIQFQPFVPNESAHAVFCEILRRCQEQGFVSYLGVFKRHRPDPFWLTHALDGWSFALDFKVTERNKDALFRHCTELVELVLGHGGKFYFAKDLVLGRGVVERMFPPEKLAAFRSLKQELDPGSVLETDLYRRVFGGSPER